ncbi:MAG: enoyl-CoA hydratase/isomerase family protein [Frankiaceae bacterium]|nr:enoyl-CoA hydratase/isomerase family protein [Frankiaceae bacterium]MBV9872484.1 enoyl-CoA hydratase/isomerase family protein [Frankiaceae bacterium]
MIDFEVAADGVAVLTLNDPANRNAWSPALEQEFYATLEAADADPSVRVVILTGAGKTFCPGAAGSRLDVIAETGISYADRVPFSRTLAFRKPLIAAINGGCAGVGFIQAMMCDVRFAAATAKLTTAFARRGLPAEHAISWLLPRLVGLENAIDLLLSGRVVTAAAAKELGLVSRVVEPDQLLDAAREYAHDIATHCGPHATALIKRQVLVDLDSSYRDALDRAVAATEAASRTPEFREGVDAFLHKREPRFADLPADRTADGDARRAK